jgi:hypothetical protein
LYFDESDIKKEREEGKGNGLSWFLPKTFV